MPKSVPETTPLDRLLSVPPFARRMPLPPEVAPQFLMYPPAPLIWMPPVPPEIKAVPPILGPLLIVPLPDKLIPTPPVAEIVPSLLTVEEPGEPSTPSTPVPVPVTTPAAEMLRGLIVVLMTMGPAVLKPIVSPLPPPASLGPGPVGPRGPVLNTEIVAAPAALFGAVRL